MLNNVRLAFPALFVPNVDEVTKRVSYGANFILAPDHPQLPDVARLMDEVGQAKWADKWPAVKKGLEKQDRLALHDGDTKGKYDGFPGNFFISANSGATQPTLLDRDRTSLTSDSRRLYSGCFVNVSLEFWAQKDHPKGGSRINAQLRGVQFCSEGEAFTSGRPADSSEFAAVTEGSAADDFA